MADIVLIDPNLISIIQGSFQASGLPMPFVREIYLLGCHIAGTSHLDLKAIEPKLQISELLVMKRETDNIYDKFAVMILTEQGEKLGYIPMEKNEVFAHLLDAGKLLFGKILEKKWQGNWLKLNIQIYLRDL